MGLHPYSFHRNTPRATLRLLPLPAQSPALPELRSAQNGRQTDAMGKVEELGTSMKPERNKPCPCGSGKKHKKCCGSVVSVREQSQREIERRKVEYRQWLQRRARAMRDLQSRPHLAHFAQVIAATLAMKRP
jgi:hypothetical protein